VVKNAPTKMATKSQSCVVTPLVQSTALGHSLNGATAALLVVVAVSLATMKSK